MAEGNMNAEVAKDLFLNIGLCERLFLILVVTLLIGYLLLFPILLSIRWDHPNSMNFAHVFIPVWLGLSAILVCSVWVFIHPTPEGEDDESNEKKLEMETQIKKVSIVSIIIIAILFGLLILLVLRLDGHTDW